MIPDEELGSRVPWLTTEQMREVDRLMMEEQGVLLLQMMENAGRNLAHLARERFLGGDPRGRRVLVLTGTGGNGGGGLVAARRLHGWGAEVRVRLMAERERLIEVSRSQLHILERSGIAVEVPSGEGELPEADLIIDAMIGYSLRGSPAGEVVSLIHAANEHPAPVLSLDVPSGVNTTTGTVHGHAVKATATMTLALPKTGLAAEEAREYVGELYLADISVPPQLYARPSLGLEVGPIFAKSEVLRLW